MTETSHWQRSLLIGTCLALVTTAVYWPVHHFEFITYDDDYFVTKNACLEWGLTLRGFVWAFTTPVDQWMPVTWLVRLIEYQWFGLNASTHHLVNVLFHVVNALLLFSVLVRMTGARWRSAMVAALFALHPLHVESVAWVTALKDVLSTFFWILTTWAYVRYTEEFTVHSSQFSVHGSGFEAQRSKLKAFYALALLFFTLGLMSKPMVITLPFVLLLLDYWPLGRTRWAKPALMRLGLAASDHDQVAPSQLLKEKLPFFMLAAVSCALTFWAQHRLGAVISLEKLSLGIRIANALLAYVGYLAKACWPTRLAFFYPLDPNLSFAAAMVAGVGLVAFTAAVIRRARREPWLATGWCWYLGTLVPVIGLVQVGSQSMADRYTYVPLVGLFMMVCWSVPRRAIESRIWKVITYAAAGAVLAACAVLSRVQAGYWKNSETLFHHALDATRDNWLAHYNLGVDLRRMGRVREAVGCFQQAVRIRPDFPEGHNNLAVALAELGRVQEAIGHYEQALQLKPGLAEVHHNLGAALELIGMRQQAIEHYEQALRIQPDLAEAHSNLGAALARLGRVQEAIWHYEQALRIQPDLAEAHSNLGVALVRLGRVQEAIEHYEQALRIQSDIAEVHYNLGNALARVGKVQEAITHYEHALRIKPDYVEAHYSLGVALAQLGRAPEAIKHWEEVLRIRSDYAEAHYNLGVVLEQMGRLPEAIGHCEQALRLKPDMAEAQSRLEKLRAAH